MFGSAAPAAERNEVSLDSAESVLVRLLFEPVSDAIEEYYKGPRQYWNERICRIEKVADSPDYEVVMQVETFCGPHNPPYGLETMTFFIRYGEIKLKTFVHQNEP